MYGIPGPRSERLRVRGEPRGDASIIPERGPSCQTPILPPRNERAIPQTGRCRNGQWRKTTYDSNER